MSCIQVDERHCRHLNDINACHDCALHPAGAFENTVQALYKYVIPKPKSECSKTEQLGVSFIAGYIAGVFCAVVSQPADNLVSKMNAQKAPVSVSHCRTAVLQRPAASRGFGVPGSSSVVFLTAVCLCSS